MPWASENRAWRLRAEEHWSPRIPEPILIRAWLAAPVAWDCYDPLTIEGALQFAVVLRETGRMPDDVFSDCPLDLGVADTDIQIPIADSKDICDIPIAMVSCGWFSPDAVPDVRWRRRRVRGEQYGQAVVNTASGDTKAEQRPIPVVVANHVDFYAMGDCEMLRELARDCGTLGAARSGGLGQVQGFEVEPTDRVWWRSGPDRQLMRTIPWNDGEPPDASDVREATLRAPYWHHRTRRMCAVPVQRLGETTA
jgi:hypothetical protein